MKSKNLLAALVGALAVAAAYAQTPPAAAPSKPLSTSLGVVVFPAKGQAAQQQSQDEGECYAWSKGQTGVDPMAPAPAAAPPPQAATGRRRAAGKGISGSRCGAWRSGWRCYR